MAQPGRRWWRPLARLAPWVAVPASVYVAMPWWVDSSRPVQLAGNFAVAGLGLTLGRIPGMAGRPGSALAALRDLALIPWLVLAAWAGERLAALVGGSLADPPLLAVAAAYLLLLWPGLRQP